MGRAGSEKIVRRLCASEILAGVTAGLLAGLAHAGLLATLTSSLAVAGLGGVEEPATGLVIHLILSTLVGITYAWLFNPPPVSYAEGLMSGSAYGLLWWNDSVPHCDSHRNG